MSWQTIGLELAVAKIEYMALIDVYKLMLIVVLVGAGEGLGIGVIVDIVM